MKTFARGLGRLGLLASTSALVASLAACASTPSDAPLVSTSTPTGEVATTGELGALAAGAPDFEVHEWGLLDVDGTKAEVHTLPKPYVEPQRPVTVKKPVLYFHLAKGTERATIDVKVTVPGDDGGAVVEHSPPGQLDDAGASIAWRGLVLEKKAGCGAGLTKDLPSKESSVCNTPDGVCEVLELGNYVTSDASCITAPGGVAVNHLFYRAREKPPVLPFEIAEVEGGKLQIKHTRASDVIGPIVYVHDDPSHPTVSVLAPPALGASITADPPTTSDVSSAALAIDAAMREAGLSDEEAAAFNRAWRSSLYGEDPAAKKQPPIAKAALAPRDYLLFVVPMSLADGVAKLTITPPPRAVRRFLLVRLEV